MGGSTNMTIIELKNFISNGLMPSDFMIFVQKDNRFLANQYLKALIQLAPNGLNKISSIYEPLQSSLALLTASDSINILTVDTFEERAEDYNQFENTIVVCDQIDKSIAKSVEKYVINFPKLEEWQIFDYIKTLCGGLTPDEINWLIKATEGNLERITNELDKVTIFDKNQQKEIFASIMYDPQTDMYNIDLFTIVNALVEGNSMVLFEFLSHNDYDFLDPVVLVNRALVSLKNIILISQNPLLTAEDCGVSAGQFKFIKYKYTSLNLEAAKAKLKFLAGFDLDLKTSKLDMSKRDMLNYLLSHLTYKITL
jgi:hypothetical protein